METLHNDEEIDCYEKILQFFNQQQFLSKENKNLWKSRSLIKIMEVWSRTRNLTLVRNSLILLISLFENVPPDLYNNRGVDIQLLSKKDRDSFMSELKDEFLAN